MNSAPSTLRLDETDIPIIRAFFTDARYYHPGRSEIRESISRVSKRLNLAEATVRKRVGKYIRGGFVTGWNLILNPNVTREFLVQVRLDVMPPAREDDVVQKLRLIDDVWVVIRYRGNVLGVGFYCRSIVSLKRKVELMAKIANSGHVDFGELAFPQCNYNFTSTDIEIIRSIQDNPRQDLVLVANRTGLSAKTVKRRINRMVGEKAIFIAPRAKFEVVRGLIPAELLAFYSSHEIAGETERKVLSIAENRACTMYIRNPDHAFLGLLLGSVKEGDELLTEIKKLRGIRAAYLDLTTEYIELYEVFKDRIDELAAQVSSRRRAVTCG